MDTSDIRAHLDRITPGSWRWGGNFDSRPAYIDLRSDFSLTPIVMTFDRWGTGGATPSFSVREPGAHPASGLMTRAHELAKRQYSHRGDIGRVDHPDAEFIAAAPDYVRHLLAENDRLRARLASAERDVEELEDELHV